MKLLKTRLIISKIQLATLISGTVCYLIALLPGQTYKDTLIDVCLLLLAVYMALRAVEIGIKIREEESKDETEEEAS